MSEKILSTVLLLLLFVMGFMPARVMAVDHSAEYTATYQMREDGLADVGYQVTLINLPKNTYIQKYAITFPETYSISNTTAEAQGIALSADAQMQDGEIVLSVTFPQPEVLSRQIDQFDIHFTQTGVFTRKGTQIEAIIPTAQNEGDTIYNVNIIMPEARERPLSLSKPNPTTVEGNRVEYRDITSSVVYALFGSKQMYRVHLRYAIDNPRLIPVETEIALPPQTLYQEVLVNSISPQPRKTYIDDDGNFMAVYSLAPKQNLLIEYEGYVTVHSAYQKSMQAYAEHAFERQKEYLLDTNEYWSLPTKLPEAVSALTTPREIYAFTTNYLEYDYGRISQNVKRMGARQALTHPKTAICMEFTDVFIALARQNGIYAREINGYALTDDDELRPLSLVGDVLHAWPEYYDTEKQIWIQVDPTWESTSGLDYFNSFDTNHIAFAIHGRDPSYPIPAGSYKSVSSKDVTVTIVDTMPSHDVALTVDIQVDSTIARASSKKGTLTITNTGNTFADMSSLDISSDVLKASLDREFLIRWIAPMEKADIPFTYTAASVLSVGDAYISVTRDGTELESAKVTVQSDFRRLLKPLIMLLIILIGALVYLVHRDHVKRRHA